MDWQSGPSNYPPPPPPPPPPSGQMHPTPAPVAATHAMPATPVARDRVMILGRRRSGKTIYLARLYEAMWEGCEFVDGRLQKPSKSSPTSGLGRTVSMSCRATTGPAHTFFMETCQSLRSGKWPGSSSGNDYSEIIVTNGSRTHAVTMLDYPGEVFRKAFMLESDDMDAIELRMSVDRAAAAILLIDPSVVVSGSSDAQEDVFGLTQCVIQIRKGLNGGKGPIVIVFTKSDINGVFLKEAGGAREVAAKHFSQLLREIGPTKIFPCSAVRVRQNSHGKQVPIADHGPDWVVEPLRFCLEQIEGAVAPARASSAANAQGSRTPPSGR